VAITPPPSCPRRRVIRHSQACGKRWRAFRFADISSLRPIASVTQNPAQPEYSSEKSCASKRDRRQQNGINRGYSALNIAPDATLERRGNIRVGIYFNLFEASRLFDQ